VENREPLAPPRTFADLVAITRTFGECYHQRFLVHDEETRADIVQLIAAAHEPDADEHERVGIYATLAQTLFPDLSNRRPTQLPPR
jgi:hypothetical protein